MQRVALVCCILSISQQKRDRHDVMSCLDHMTTRPHGEMPTRASELLRKCSMKLAVVRSARVKETEKCGESRDCQPLVSVGGGRII
jgi:hypothetical protein